MNARIEGFAPRIASVSEQVTGLTKTLAGIASRDDFSRASALLVTTGLAREAFQRQEALGGVIETLRAIGAPVEIVGALAPFATAGAASPAQLLAEFRATSAKSDPRARDGGDVLEKLRAGAASLIEIRRTGEITGTDDAAHIARAEQALQRGEVATALTLISRLTPPRAEAFAGWRERAAQHVSALDALARLRAESLARLTRAASGQK